MGFGKLGFDNVGRYDKNTHCCKNVKTNRFLSDQKLFCVRFLKCTNLNLKLFQFGCDRCNRPDTQTSPQT